MNTIIGIALGLVCVLASIMTSGEIGSFIDGASIFIVVGGTICAGLASFSFDAVKQTIAAISIAIKKENSDYNDDIEYIIKIANIARKDGLLALEELTEEMQDPFLKKAIMLVVDGSDPELIQSILETEIDATKARHSTVWNVLDGMAGYAPAFGMIGTLIGLINMLKNLSDMSSLGPNMSVALVTTFYGSAMANLIFNPFSKRLKTIGSIEYTRKELVLEGVLAIQNGENPRVIKEKLNSFLSKKAVEVNEKKSEASKGGE